jgi:NOL1/NOP2/sun family putative RNA methylase
MNEVVAALLGSAASETWQCGHGGEKVAQRRYRGTIIYVMVISGPPTVLPADFQERLTRLLSSDQLRGWLAAFEAMPGAAFRVNTLVAEESAVLEELRSDGLEPERLDWPPEAWSVYAARRRALTDTAAAVQGRLYIQSPSSMVPVQVLDPQPGEEILDLAAAPGGKTLHLAARMRNEGRIGAVESVKGRFHRLRRNLDRCGATIVDTYLADGAAVGRKVPERFDRVLLDAPCSSEGRFRAHDPESLAYWSLKKVREMARKQRKLANSAVQALKTGGVLVYCTCTLAPEENEAIIDGLLKRFGDALGVEPMDLPVDHATAGIGTWGKHTYADAVRDCARIQPDGVREGFFIAKLRKHAPTAP